MVFVSNEGESGDVEIVRKSVYMLLLGSRLLVRRNELTHRDRTYKN